MKKGFELSINFIIVMILCILILGFGISIFTKIFIVAENAEFAMSESAKIKIQQLLDTGAPVALPENVKTIEAGDKYIFGLGVVNYDADKTFQVQISSDFPAEIPDTEITYDTNPFSLARGEKKFLSFLVQVPGFSPSGSYTLTVTVNDVTNPNTQLPYYETKKVYINVP